VELWFWGWVVVAVSAGAVALLFRDRTAWPFAMGAAAAALVEALWRAPAWEWIALVAVSSVTFVALNRVRYRKRHSHEPRGRHSTAARRGRD